MHNVSLKHKKNDNGVLGIRANYSYLVNHNGYDRLEAEGWEPYELVDNKTGESVKEDVYVPTDFVIDTKKEHLHVMGHL